MTIAKKVLPIGQQTAVQIFPTEKSAAKIMAVGLILIAATTAVAYSSTLFGWFAGDDFVALRWLDRCLIQPELLFRNFVAGLWDVPTNKFYRPLFGLSLSADYAVWHRHFVGFHITNLWLHLANMLLVCGISKKLIGFRSNQDGLTGGAMTALLAAALFALYPLHPEVVAWTSGRVDSLATLFYLAGLWCYMQWRGSGRLSWMIGSCLSMAASLGSKEVAIVFPLTVTAYELWMQPGSAGSRQSLTERARTIFIATSPFWIILTAYFLLRRFALGTFVGGYDDGVWISNWQQWKPRFLMSLQTLALPLNEALFGRHDIRYQFWKAILLSAPVMLIVRSLNNSKLVRQTFFLLSWFAISLIPVLRLLDVRSDLEGGRYFYLPLVPGCMLLALAFAGQMKNYSLGWLNRPFRFLSSVAASLLLMCSFAIVQANDPAWAQAGHESNNIRAAFTRLFAAETTSPIFLIFGMPDNIAGSVVARNALGGLTNFADVPRIATLDLDNYLPFGFLKDSIAKDSAQIRLCHWNSEEATFDLVHPSPETTSARIWNGDQMHNVLAAPQAISHWTDGGLEVMSTKVPIIPLQMDGLSCWGTDLLVVHVKDVPDEHSSPNTRAYLEFSNKLCSARTIDGNADVDNNGQTWTFILHRDPTWALGGKGHDLSLSFSGHTHLLIDSIRFLPAKECMPSLDFPDSGCLGQAGRVHLNSTHDSEAVSYTVESIPGAVGCILEIGKPGVCFEEHVAHPMEEAKVMSRITSSAPTGSFTVNRNLFPGSGDYWLRAWALDSQGARIGMPSDHIVACCESPTIEATTASASAHTPSPRAPSVAQPLATNLGATPSVAQPPAGEHR